MSSDDESRKPLPGENLVELRENVVVFSEKCRTLTSTWPAIIQDGTRRSGSWRVRLCEDPLERDTGVENVFHSSSQASRVRSTAMLSRPCFRKTTSRICSERA